MQCSAKLFSVDRKLVKSRNPVRLNKKMTSLSQAVQRYGICGNSSQLTTLPLTIENRDIP